MINFVFDLDDTIYNQFSPFQKAYDSIFHKMDAVDVYKLYIDSRKYSDEVFHLTESGELDVHEMHCNRIQLAFEQQGITIDKEQAATFQVEYADQQYKITIVPEIQQVFNMCKEKGIEIGIITNGPSMHQRMKMKALGLSHWFEDDKIIISSEVDVAKPSKEIFAIAEKQFGFAASHTYYVGDSFQNDVIGAKSAEWKSIWVNHRNRTIDNDEFTPDYQVFDNQQLLQLVNRLIG
ncbi:HAD family hydrolase [Bacillus massiliigorillae]|uniref:HAD family hydrolase n=1 Tax=Bacillus massiliigorillae TaxID=1243664 RepID=UPI00039D2E32|nr:HAD family hydrolase [Bacillus massiliigorillae]